MTLEQLEHFSLTAIVAFKDQMVYLANRESNGALVGQAQSDLLRYYSVARSIYHYATGFNENIEQENVENAVYFLMERLNFTTSLTQETNINQTDIVTLSWL